MTAARPALLPSDQAGPVRVTQDLGYLEWQFGPQGAAPVVRGVDVAHVRDGLIASVYTLRFTD